MEFYNENIKDELGMNDYIFFDEWYDIVKEILIHPEFQLRKLFRHHKNKSVFAHCIEVSYSSFLAAKYFNASIRVCAIAGLLHDFYPNAWLYSEELVDYDSSYLRELTIKKPLLKYHAFVHAKEASINYVKYFPNLEDKRITNAIKRHMFPLNIIPPRYKESWIVSLIDKRRSIFELPNINMVSKYVKDKITFLIHGKI